MSALRLVLLISKTENWPWNLCMFYQNFQGELEYCGILTCVLSVYVKFRCWTGLRSMGSIKEIVIGGIRVVSEISRSSLLWIDYPINCSI